jgi:hypothetical protein
MPGMAHIENASVSCEWITVVVNDRHWKIRVGSHINFDQYAVAGDARVRLDTRSLV